nr:RGCVC family protein [Pseudonocardia acaciae]
MTTTSHDDPSGSEGACEACGHDVSSHDATAQRFCRVSHERGLDRGCICRDGAKTPEASAPAEPSGAPMYGRGRFSGR